jgi:hypothetical protein
MRLHEKVKFSAGLLNSVCVESGGGLAWDWGEFARENLELEATGLDRGFIETQVATAIVADNNTATAALFINVLFIFYKGN